MIERIFALLIFASLTANLSEAMAQEQKIQLEIPPEPEQIKENLERQFRLAEIENDPYGKNTTIWKWRIGGGYNITSYLWDYWESELNKYGITYQDLEKIYSETGMSRVFTDWVKGDISWDEAVSSFIKGIENWIENTH